MYQRFNGWVDFFDLDINLIDHVLNPRKDLIGRFVLGVLFFSKLLVELMLRKKTSKYLLRNLESRAKVYL